MNSPVSSSQTPGDAARAGLTDDSSSRRTFVGFRQPRIENKAHLQFIRSLPCLICGNDIETEAAHLRMCEPRAAKRYVGKSEKADDVWTLPLCGKHHQQQHKVGERAFWEATGIDPVFVALALARVSGNIVDGEQIVRHAR
jgi:hypothetical protein